MGSEPPAIDDTVDWLQDQGYGGSVEHHRVVDGQQPITEDLDVDSSVAVALAEQGISSLYSHQTAAIEAIREGDNTVVATPTASGKTLTYVVPALERAIDRQSKTLYIAPYRALINDQEETIRAFADELGFGASVDVGVQIGSTPTEERRRIKQSQPDVILMTLDQVHLSLLPWGHARNHWRWLFHQLETVVIDEVHKYRGVFGSHAALIFRRLNRFCDHYDTSPQYVCCSATIGNPVEHAAAVTGQSESSFTLVDDDTSASGDRHWLFWNPPLKKTTTTSESQEPERMDPNHPAGNPIEPDYQGGEGGTVAVSQNRGPRLSAQDEELGGERQSHHAHSVNLFSDLVSRGYQTLVFTSARQGAEQYVDWCDSTLRGRGKTDLAKRIHAYHAALPDERRRELEKGLRSGEIRGVWSTEALELGIDIGTLDVVILDGYPGTSMNTFQRAGRAGRGEDSCLVVLVASDNPLDQYTMEDPDQLFEDGAEEAVVNPQNDAILPDHIVCAADDHYLSPDDEQYFGDNLPHVVREAEEADRLQRVDRSDVRWGTPEDSPQYNTDIRSIDDREITLIDRHKGETITTMEYSAALRDVFPEAIYYHQKQTYKVADLDLGRDVAKLETIETDEYTRPLREKDVTIEDLETHTTLDVGSETIEVSLASMTVSNQVTGYLHYSHSGDDEPQNRELQDSLPPHEVDTQGLFFTIPDEIEHEMTSGIGGEEEYLAALHAVEHAVIALFPTKILCDRGDIGGLSAVSHDEVPGGVVFLHDAHPGGAGLTRRAFEQLDELLAEALSRIRECGCQDGCPSCIHSPHCGNANDGLDKQRAGELLSRLCD
jgi:DEAD/DEAH box helicase domain-containing protein